MSYSINLSGHGPDADDLKEVFENAVRALRAITPDGQTVGGSLSGSGPDGQSFPSVMAGDVADETEAADVDGDEGDAGETDPDAETPAGTEP